MKFLSSRLGVLLALVAILVWVLVSHIKKGKEEALDDREERLSAAMVAAGIPKDSAKISDLVMVVNKSAVPAPLPAKEEDKEYFTDDPQKLQKQIAALLGEVKNEKPAGKLTALIVPHAGIRYSGKVSAAAFRQLKEKSFDTVVILAPNHKEMSQPGIVIHSKGKLRTPLGKIEVDEKLAKALCEESSEFEDSARPFEGDPAIEVQLPFLQSTLKEFRVLPILIGGRSAERCARLADALVNATQGKKVLLVATTHLSSGEPYDKAKRLDFLVTSALERCEGESLVRYENEGLVRICGYAPVLTLFYVMKERGVTQGRVLQYANTADVTGKKEGRIVGYAAVVYERNN